MRPGRCLLTLLLTAILLNAQATNQQPRFTVAGSVVNSITGEPIRRALVQIFGLEQHSAFTGGDGRFEIEGVIQGQFLARAQKPGFFDFRSLAGTDFAAAPAPIKVAAGTASVLLKLVPESSIEGHVVDNDGEAIEGMQVQCMRQEFSNGRRIWQPAGGAQTDETGTFHVESLTPGVYLVSTRPQQRFGFLDPRASSELARQVYPERFYPNATEMASAQPLVVRPGEKAQADFTIASVHAFHGSGSVSLFQNGVSGTLETTDGQQFLMGVNINPNTGQWTIPTIPPGSWILVFHALNSRGESFYAEQPLNVTSSDIQNVQVTLQPLLSIPVNVVWRPRQGSATGAGAIDTR
jgi:hypothetical protein